MKRDLMFVCTGNTCRSPMAEGLAKSILGEEAIVRSSGIAVAYEDGANGKALQVMADRDIDISGHRSKQFDPKDVTDNMIVLTMTLRHKLYLTGSYPELSDRIFTIMECAGEDGDVVDPYGYDITYYRACADQLEKLIGILVQMED